MRRPTTLALVALAIVCLGLPGRADVKVTTQFDKDLDFSKLRTWAWNDTGAGKVMMAVTADDDPEVVRQRAEPVIKEAVAAEFSARGIAAPAAGAAPDLEMTYYVLITVGTDAQTIGQFVPAVAQWGLPPLSGATQSYKVIERGSLVLDISVNNTVVWRGIGQAELKPGQSMDKRRTLLRAAIKDIMKKYPPKK